MARRKKEITVTDDIRKSTIGEIDKPQRQPINTIPDNLGQQVTPKNRLNDVVDVLNVGLSSYQKYKKEQEAIIAKEQKAKDALQKDKDKQLEAKGEHLAEIGAVIDTTGTTSKLITAYRNRRASLEGAKFKFDVNSLKAEITRDMNNVDPNVRGKWTADTIHSTLIGMAETAISDYDTLEERALFMKEANKLINKTIDEYGQRVIDDFTGDVLTTLKDEINMKLPDVINSGASIREWIKTFQDDYSDIVVDKNVISVEIANRLSKYAEAEGDPELLDALNDTIDGEPRLTSIAEIKDIYDRGKSKAEDSKLRLEKMYEAKQIKDMKERKEQNRTRAITNVVSLTTTDSVEDINDMINNVLSNEGIYADLSGTERSTQVKYLRNLLNTGTNTVSTPYQIEKDLALKNANGGLTDEYLLELMNSDRISVKDFQKYMKKLSELTPEQKHNLMTLNRGLTNVENDFFASYVLDDIARQFPNSVPFLKNRRKNARIAFERKKELWIKNNPDSIMTVTVLEEMVNDIISNNDYKVPTHEEVSKRFGQVSVTPSNIGDGTDRTRSELMNTKQAQTSTQQEPMTVQQQDTRIDRVLQVRLQQRGIDIKSIPQDKLEILRDRIRQRLQ